MKLQKLRVKVKQTAKPQQSVQRITSVRKENQNLDFDIPALSGMGSGLDKSIGGFQMVADLSQMSLFGGGK